MEVKSEFLAKLEKKSLKYPFNLKAAQNRRNSEAFTAVTFQNKPVSSIELILKCRKSKSSLFIMLGRIQINIEKLLKY